MDTKPHFSNDYLDLQDKNFWIGTSFMLKIELKDRKKTEKIQLHIINYVLISQPMLPAMFKNESQIKVALKISYTKILF